jgi:hypothetical protein
MSQFKAKRAELSKRLGALVADIDLIMQIDTTQSPISRECDCLSEMAVRITRDCDAGRLREQTALALIETIRERVQDALKERREQLSRHAGG